MPFPPTLSLRAETYVAVLTDIAESLLQHGFDDIFLLGNSGGGGNQKCLAYAAERLNDELAYRPVNPRLLALGRRPRIHAMRAYYTSTFTIDTYMASLLGFTPKPEPFVHDDFQTEALLASIDPALIRTEQRMRAGLTTARPLGPPETPIAICTFERAASRAPPPPPPTVEVRPARSPSSTTATAGLS